MTYDQAQSPRLGQRAPVESTYVQIVDVDPDNLIADLPEAAWHGQLLFNNTRGVLMIYNAYADTGATWQDVAGGVAGQLTYVGTEFPVATPPATFAIGDQYYDSDDGMRGYVWDGDSWEQVLGDAVFSYVVEYAVNSSETVAPSSGWSIATPTRAPGTFVWVRTVITYNDGTTTTTNPALMTGNTGAQGEPGDPGPQGVPGPSGANGQQLYTWIKYADTPTTGMSDSPTNKDYLGIAYNKTTATESSVYADYEWSLTQGETGSQGVQGPAGANGQPTYTWIKYGTSAAGAGLQDSPSGMTYMGIAYNKTTATESTTAGDYEWSLIQGPPGANAATVTLTSTTQTLVSPAAGGATTPTTATVTGTAVNTTITVWEYSVNSAAFSATVPPGVSRTGDVVTITGSTMTAATIAVRMASASGVADTLTVAKVFNGATGSTGGTGGTGPAGADAYTVLLSNEAHTFPGTASNTAANGNTLTNILAYQGATKVAATIGTITGLPAAGMTATPQNNGQTNAAVLVGVTLALTQQSGILTIPITVDGTVFSKSFSWSVSYIGPPGSTGSTGVSVTAITPYFAKVTKGAAAPAQPAVATPLAPWVAIEPGYTANTELYRTEKVTYSNATFSYATVTKVSSYQAASDAMDVAIVKTQTYYAPGFTLIDPGNQDSGFVPDPDWMASQQAQNTADGKSTFIQAAPPTSVHIGDMWFDSDNDHLQYLAASVGANETTVGEWEPTGIKAQPLWTPIAGNVTGDIWYQTDDDYRQWYYNGTSWLDASPPNTDIRDAIEGNVRGLGELAIEVDELSFLATSANNTADTADGRVSMSDYQPGADDLTYLQKNTDTETGVVTIVEVPRVDGSIWYTRTRPRRNLCKNPSFETDTTGWSVFNCAIARDSAMWVPAGVYTLKVTNLATVNTHYVQWGTSVADRVECSEGQIYTVSAYAELISGTQGGTGASMMIIWLDAAGAVLSQTNGIPQPLVLNAFDPLTLGTMAEPRIYVTGTAPANAAFFYVRVNMSSGNEGVVWHTGAMLVEQQDDLGRYFDGDTQALGVGSVALWDDVPHASASSLEGDKILEIWELRDSSWVRKYLTSATIEELDAFKLTGVLDGSILGEATVSANAMRTSLVQTSEALAQGDLVHIWNDSGVFKVRKASAAARYDAHGFVWYSSASGALARVYHVGYNPFMVNLAPGAQWLSAVPGKVTNQPPSAIGQIVQRVGYAPSPTHLNFSPATVVRII